MMADAGTAAEAGTGGGSSGSSSQPPTDLSKLYSKFGIDFAVNTTFTLGTALIFSQALLRNPKSKFFTCGIGLGIGLGWSLADASVTLKDAYANNRKLDKLSAFLDNKATRQLASLPTQFKNFFSSFFQ